VTTAQIVRSMNRGETGSISVSMVPLGQTLLFLLSAADWP
jgi:hypothetical protein